jgi:hypothetical protein
MFGCATFMPTKSLETPATQAIQEVFFIQTYTTNFIVHNKN